MEYTIKNTTKRGRAFPVKGGGLTIVQPGETATIVMRSAMPDTRLAALKGDGIEVTGREAQEEVPAALDASASPSAPADLADDDQEIEVLRAQYRELKGEDADRRWKAARLRSEIDELTKA